jgi:hypothetical protein
VRLRIWGLALLGPCMLDVGLCTVIGTDGKVYFISQVCSESRQEVFKRYSKLSSTAPLGWTNEGIDFINFEIDTLYFSCNHEKFPLFWEADIDFEQLNDNLRFLAITRDAWKTLARLELAIQFIKQLSNLEELTVICRQDVRVI